MEIKATFDSHKLEADFGRFSRNQIPFAASLALTRVAGLAKDKIIEQLPNKFKIRNTWTAGGIRAERALKNDWPNCKAQVGSIDPYMIDFEDGGARKNFGGRNASKKPKTFVIPQAIRKQYGISDSKIIPKKLWAGKLLSNPKSTASKTKGKRKKPKPFLFVSKSGMTGVAIRNGTFRNITGKRGKPIKRENINLLWKFQKKPTNVPKREWLVKTTESIVNTHMQSEFGKALRQALDTAR